MKKFIGNINGKEFNDMGEFYMAVSEAINSGETPLSITSYYKICDDVEEIKDEPKKMILDFDTISCFKMKMDYNGEFIVPENINDIFNKTSNLSEIKDKIYDTCNDIARKINSQYEIINNYSKQLNYYNKLKSAINEVLPNTTDKTEPNKKSHNLIDKLYDLGFTL